MKKPISDWDWFRTGGLVFLIWTAVNTYFSISRYGLDQGMYWWFCNLAMAGIGYALWIRHPGILIGWISIALFTQTFWLLDNVVRVATGANLLGLVEFMYQPGMPMDEFVMSHYHFFILPTALFALFFLKEKRVPVWIVVLINVSIFGISYFVFPAKQNINCIHFPCAPALQHWTGPLYSILFFSVVCAFCLLFCQGLYAFYSRVRLGAKGKRILTSFFVGVILVGLVISCIDIGYKSSIPWFACAKPFENDEVRIACRFTLEHDVKVLSLVYEIENKTDRPRLCRSFIEYGGKKEVLGENIHLVQGRKQKIATFLSYPEVDTLATLTAECENEGQFN